MIKINDYINKNYNKLKKLATDVFLTQKSKYKHLEKREVDEYTTELLTYLWQTMMDKSKIFIDMPLDEMDKWSYKFIHNAIKWTRNKINYVSLKDNVINNAKEFSDKYDNTKHHTTSQYINDYDSNCVLSKTYNNKYDNCMYDDLNIESMSFIADNAPTHMKDYIKNCISNGMSEDNILKIIIIGHAKQELHITHRAIFEMYFEQNLSIRKISELTNVNTSYILKHINESKNLIQKRVKEIMEEHNG